MHSTLTRRAARRIALGAGLLAILVATPAYAQDRGHRHDMEGRLAELQEKLDLTDSQVDQIRAIFTEQKAKMDQLHADQNGDREASRQLHDEIHERIQAILTEEQRNRLEQLHAEHGEAEHGERHGDQGGEPKNRPHHN